MSAKRRLIFITILTFGVCPPTFSATFNIANGDVAGLKNAINTANTNNENDLISLAAGGVYTLTTIENNETGLPTIQVDTNHSLTINGNGARIARSTAGGTPNFRILRIDAGAQVILDRVTVARGQLLTGAGGGITNFGTLTLMTCVIEDNGIFGGKSAPGATRSERRPSGGERQLDGFA